MSLKLKAMLASAVLVLSIGSVPSAQAAKRLTVPDPDWTCQRNAAANIDDVGDRTGKRVICDVAK